MADKPDETRRATIPKLPKLDKAVTGEAPTLKPPPTPPTRRPDTAKPEADEEPTDTRGQQTRIVNVPPIGVSTVKKPAHNVAPPSVAPPSTAPPATPTSAIRVTPPIGVSVTLDAGLGRKAFDEAASPYTLHLRDVLLEIGFGEPEPVREWLERARTTLRALIAMAETAQLPEHARCFGQVSRAVDTALAQAGALSEANRSEVVQSFKPVVALSPRLGFLEAERDRRQPAIVSALLGQIDGVEQPVIDALHAANLDGLDTLGASDVEELAKGACVRNDIAAAIIERFVAYRAERRGLLATGSRTDERNRLEQHVEQLRGWHDAFEQNSQQWSDEARAQKRVLRKQREQVFHRVRLMLARLGEIDIVEQLVPMSYADRVTTVERFLGSRAEIERKPMPTFARDEVIKKVLQGEHLDRTDLRGLDLSKSRLVKAMLDRADLEGANLDTAELSESSLKRTNLRGAYLAGADLSEANLENADLEGANLERANLAGANLTRANLEGANLTGANLNGARLAYAQMTSAKLGNAYLPECVLAHAELVDAYLGQVIGDRATLDHANLTGAILDGALFPGATFNGAKLGNALLRDANLNAASLVRADLSGADLTGANLADTDLRNAIFVQATLAGARLTGAKTSGLVGTGQSSSGVEAEWLDLSTAGDGSNLVRNGQIPMILSQGASALAVEVPVKPALVSAPPPVVADENRRYFGRGDVIRDATLHFDAGVRVQLDSLFENCTLHLADKTDVVIGAAGVLADCQIVGPGSLTIHGKFFEKKSPGINGARDILVSAQAALVSTIAQHTGNTRFAFEAGCQLRVKIVPPRPDLTEKPEVKR